MRELPTFRGPGRAAVYVVQRLDRKRFKVGWSVAPIRRVRLLPEFEAGELDLAASVALWLPNRHRAEHIEDAVHKCLSPYGAETGHRMDGFSECILPPAHPMAVRLLSQVPVDERTDRRVRLAPLQAAAPARDAVPIDIGPQDTWWALEDLWTRLAMHCDLSVEREGGTHRIVIPAFRQAWDGPVGALRRDVMDTETYRWHARGTSNEFVKLIDYRGDDLVCTLASLRLIESWPDGDDLVWQLRGFLLRLERLSEQARRGRCERAGRRA